MREGQKYLIRDLIVSVLQLFITFAHRSLLIPILLINFFFIIVIIVNIRSTELTSFFFSFPLWKNLTQDGLDENDILLIIAQVVTLTGIITISGGIIYKFLSMKNLNLFSSKKSFFAVFSIPFLLAVISCFLPTAAPGSKSIIIVLIIFWLVSLVISAVYYFLIKLPGIIADIILSIRIGGNKSVTENKKKN